MPNGLSRRVETRPHLERKPNGLGLAPQTEAVFLCPRETEIFFTGRLGTSGKYQHLMPCCNCPRELAAPEGSRSGIQMPEVKDKLFNGVLVVAMFAASPS